MSNQPKNIWDTMVLFNQLTLRNILNGRDDLGTPEVRMAVAALAEEQKADTLLFLNNNIEALAALLSGRGSLAIELVRDCWTVCPHLSPTRGLFLILGTLATLQWK